jgi:hypothetical protein
VTLTIEPPPLEREPVELASLEFPDAGVIEEARARQRRHRRGAGGAFVAAVALAAILLGFAGGHGGSHPGSASAQARRSPARTAHLSPALCGSGKGKSLQGAPSKSLLSILSVLRRPASAADGGSGIAARGVVQGVFVNYIRRARVVAGSSYYIYPAILGGCGTGEAPHQGINDLATHVNLGAGIIGGSGEGGATATQIEQGQAVGTGPPGSSTSATITMIVPDGVASVTLRYPAGRASGYSKKISPPFTTTTTPVNNQVVVSVPRSAGGGPIRKPTMIWRTASGRVIKTFHRL